MTYIFINDNNLYLNIFMDGKKIIRLFIFIRQAIIFLENIFQIFHFWQNKRSLICIYIPLSIMLQILGWTF